MKIFYITGFALILSLPCAAQRPATATADGYILAADKLVAEKEYEKAIGYYSEALMAGADSLQVLSKRAGLNFVIQKHGHAIRDFTVLIKLDPGSAGEYYYMRALSSLSVPSQISGLCDDLLKAKELKYSGDWKSFYSSCPQLRKDNE